MDMILSVKVQGSYMEVKLAAEEHRKYRAEKKQMYRVRVA